MSKKILSLALAVVMLFSICAVAVSAVQADGTETVRIYMTSDATVGAPAGTVVKVSYYIDLPDGMDELQMCAGNIALGWDSAAYAVNSTQTTNAADARTWGADFEQYMKSTAAVTVSTAISNNILKKANANDTAKGFNKACQVQMVYDGVNSTGSTGFPVYDNQHIFTMEFVAQRELTANDVIGVVEGAYGQSFFKVCYFNGTTTAQTFPVAQVNMVDAAGVAPTVAAPSTFKVTFDANGGTGSMTEVEMEAGEYTLPDCGFTAPAGHQFMGWLVDDANKAVGEKITVSADTVVKAIWEAYDVYHVAAKNGDAKTRVNAEDASKYDIGVKFGFKAATIAPELNANGTSDNILSISATITANKADGSTATVTPEGIRFIYDLSGGAKTEFGFNVIIAGIPNGDAAVTSYTITPTITTRDGNAHTCETKTITVADLKFA